MPTLKAKGGQGRAKPDAIVLQHDTPVWKAYPLLLEATPLQSKFAAVREALRQPSPIVTQNVSSDDDDNRRQLSASYNLYPRFNG